MSVFLKWNIMKIWAAFLLYVPCSSPFVILLLKIVVEYANSDNGAVLESIAGIFYMTTLAFSSFVLCGMYQREPIQEALACFIKRIVTSYSCLNVLDMSTTREMKTPVGFVDKLFKAIR